MEENNSNTENGKSNGAGRPLVSINLAEVLRLADLGVSISQAAVALGLTESGFRKRLDRDFKVAGSWDRGRAERELRLPKILQKVNGNGSTALKILREKSGMTMAEIQSLLALSGYRHHQSALEKWERDGNNFAIDTSRRLFQYFDNLGLIPLDGNGRSVITPGSIFQKPTNSARAALEAVTP